MDALRNIINNVPEWVQQLDGMGDEIERRQAQLAALCIASSSRSLRGKGSTESLKLKDGNADVTASPADKDVMQDIDSTAPSQGEKQIAHLSSPSSETPLALQKQTQDSFAKAQAYARAEVKKRMRAESVMSNEEGCPPKYRSKVHVEVFYDGFVEKFFENLVKFVSASRNLMRKARTAAKVAHIRRVAEIVGPANSNGKASRDLKPDISLTAVPTTEVLPSLRYLSTRRLDPRAGPSYSRAGQADDADDPPSAYDELDKALEYAQATAEHAAHQFLRDGQCREEIGNILRRLLETKEMAAREIERVEREEPELLTMVNESSKVRTLRPTSMRRELTPAKDSDLPITPRRLEVDAKLEADTKTSTTKIVEVDVFKPLEADDAPIEADDEGVDDMEEISLPPRLNYRSTRATRRLLRPQ